MPAAAPQPALGRWRDADGAALALFSQVEQVADGTEPTLLSSRLHQQGQVVGWDRESLFVCFPGNQVISLRPDLVRVLDVLDAVPGGD